MSESSSTLSALVPTTAPLLAYSIPLLIISIPFTFAGTFLTLDRSRSFPSSYTPVTISDPFDGSKKFSKFQFPLQGGVGGLLSGYVFGGVWVLSCISTTMLGGRYRYCARTFTAAAGGCTQSSLALTISVIIHPPLLPRQILTGLSAGISILLILISSLPHLAQILRTTLRVLTASSGAFSLVLSVALLAHIPAWADIWERLWLDNGDNWGTSKEKGLSSFCVILFIAGIAADFGLNHWLGECPDEKWDNFLADYSTRLTNDSDRAGTFHPLPSFWGRLLGSYSKGDKKDDIFPLTFPNNARNSVAKETHDFLLSDEDDYNKDFAKPPLSSHDHTYDHLPAIPAFLKKARSRNTKFKRKKGSRGFQDITSRRRQPIKFGQDLSSDSSDDDSDGPWSERVRPWLRQKASMSFSSPTLVDQLITRPLRDRTHDLEHSKSKKAQEKAGNAPSIAPVYSDYEEDIGAPNANTDGDIEWRPGFMNRYSSSAGVSRAGGATASFTGSLSFAPKGTIPATPSLIKALDRISAAQREAFEFVSGSSTLTSTQSASDSERKGSTTRVEGLPQVPETDLEGTGDYSDIEFIRKGRLMPSWEEFWKEVKDKATR
ncbi:hypothetical protein C0995_003250 [Termitomyces sp. Mi166|nr:hypothetical protein C0995_003250 [Termitomyces sp. Mi166\